MKDFDKFGGFTNNQVKTVTEDLDYTLKVLLPEVIFFIIKDLFDISPKESKQYLLDGGIAYDRRTFQMKVGRIENFRIFVQI